MKFTLPISQAVLLDDDDNVIRDVTKKMKQYSGPHGDYHGMDVPAKYLFMYDNYSKIQVTNVVNSVQTVSKVSSTLQF